jgi:hypothetical protein
MQQLPNQTQWSQYERLISERLNLLNPLITQRLGRLLQEPAVNVKKGGYISWPNRYNFLKAFNVSSTQDKQKHNWKWALEQLAATTNVEATEAAVDNFLVSLFAVVRAHPSMSTLQKTGDPTTDYVLDNCGLSSSRKQSAINPKLQYNRFVGTDDTVGQQLLRRHVKNVYQLNPYMTLLKFHSQLLYAFNNFTTAEFKFFINHQYGVNNLHELVDKLAETEKTLDEKSILYNLAKTRKRHLQKETVPPDEVCVFFFFFFCAVYYK